MAKKLSDSAKKTARKIREVITAHNKRPDTALDGLERLAAAKDDSTDKSNLLDTLRSIRSHIAKGDARWAAYEGIRAGILAHSLGWSPEDAEQGRKVREGREFARNKEKGRQSEFQETLDLVRKEEPDLLRTAAKEEAARRCKVSYRTIHRHAKW